MFLPQRVAVHHSASGRATTFAQVEHWHTDPKRIDSQGINRGGKGWPAPGYNVMFNELGNRKTGRMVPQRGAAVALRNSGTISLLVMGHNSLVIPRGKPLWRVAHERRRWQQTAVDGLVAYLDGLFTVWPHLGDHLGGHRDFTVRGRSTECPGLDIRKLRSCGWNIERYWRQAA